MPQSDCEPDGQTDQIELVMGCPENGRNYSAGQQKDREDR